jgi:hypothetical protein
VQTGAILLTRADSLSRFDGQKGSALNARREAETELRRNAQVERQAAA